jgi:predicted DNA-binding ribbon-helix-helix protein
MVYIPQPDEAPVCLPSPRPSLAFYPPKVDTQRDFIYRSLRVYPSFWAHIERLAGREQISVNALINALLSVALTMDREPEGRAVLQEACGQWRLRQETKLTARRRARAEADAPQADER